MAPLPGVCSRAFVLVSTRTSYSPPFQTFHIILNPDTSFDESSCFQRSHNPVEKSRVSGTCGGPAHRHGPVSNSLQLTPKSLRESITSDRQWIPKFTVLSLKQRLWCNLRLSCAYDFLSYFNDTILNFHYLRLQFLNTTNCVKKLCFSLICFGHQLILS